MGLNCGDKDVLFALSSLPFAKCSKGKLLASTLNYIKVTILCIFIVDQLFEGVEQRPRSLSDPVIKHVKKLENTFLQQSLRIVADTERKRRLEAEKKLKKHIAGQSLELHFPELQLYADKSYKDDAAHDDADDNSSTTSTLDEGNFFYLIIILK